MIVLSQQSILPEMVPWYLHVDNVHIFIMVTVMAHWRNPIDIKDNNQPSEMGLKQSEIGTFLFISQDMCACM